MTRADRVRVLLIWPGGLFQAGANFGIPQVLSLASVCRKAGAQVDVVDLDFERAFGPVDLAAIVRRRDHYDLVGISCYSSYDYLKVMELGRQLRKLLPKAVIVTGGYHPSARPEDFGSHVPSLGEAIDSPFDFTIVGDGELPLKRLVEGLQSGNGPLTSVLGPQSLPNLSELDPVDWNLLERYRPIARRVASQAEIYLARGCPYDCAFCMERAKRDVSWRALEPARAVEELHRLDRFLDLSRWTLFVADALFGMKQSWRREFLEGLVRRPIRARKIWLLIRLDLIEREDIALMARANVGPGFGLESGDPGQLQRIRKTGRLHGYLEQMMLVADWCHEYEVPFGANVIVGHPGETAQSMRTSARFLSRLFAEDPRGTMGFLSVDPFRLYPGSTIDRERATWEAVTGMRIHRYPWWHDGDQDFLSEWVDPSSELDFHTALRLRHELFSPILHTIRQRFAYQGPARDYFVRSMEEQIALVSPRRQLRTLGLWHLWRTLVEPSAMPNQAAIAPSAFSVKTDLDLADIARRARSDMIRTRLPEVGSVMQRVLEAVPREQFVRLEDIANSADDRALLLSDDGEATISALHAYATSFAALELSTGDALVELGGGTGYGAAVAAELVGPTGTVLTVEIDSQLAAQAADNLTSWPHARVVCADAHRTDAWRGARKVSVAFAVAEVPTSWFDALGERGALVAPVETARGQTLVLFRKEIDGSISRREITPVRYVPDRSGQARQPRASDANNASTSPRQG